MKITSLPRKADVLAALTLLLAPVLAVIPAAIPASAHHSAAPFDQTRQVSLTGTVERWVWSNPHSWLYIRVAKDDGTTEVWGLEAGSTNMLARSGWNSRDMRPGDRVMITASPARSGGRLGLLSSVRLPDGRMLNSGFGPPPPRAN